MSNKALTALGKVWSQIPTLSLDAENPHFSSKFVSLPNIVASLRPILAEAGIYYIQRSVESERGLALQTIIVHAESGETYDAGTIYLPVRDNPQAVGSAMTYGRRYSLCAVFGIVADEDDDANRGAAPAPRTREVAGDNTNPSEGSPGAWRHAVAKAIMEWTGIQDDADLKSIGAKIRKAADVDPKDGSVKACKKLLEFIGDNKEKQFDKVLSGI